MIFGEHIHKPLILDGAVGSLLAARRNKMHPKLWSSFLNISNPQSVRDLHKEYLHSGADIITTNTFRTNPHAFKQSNIDYNYEDFVRESVAIGAKLKPEFNFILAGSNAPAEDCYQSKRTISKDILEYNHKKHIELLFEFGCDFILNETQSQIDEIEIIARFCSDNKIPFVISLFFNADLKLLSGEPISEIIPILDDYGPELISFNCIKINELSDLCSNLDLSSAWGFYLNVGKDRQTSEKLEIGMSPKDYAHSVKDFINFEPKMIGSCCGSTPEHTAELRELVDAFH